MSSQPEPADREAEAHPSRGPHAPSRGRRWSIRALFVLATVLATFGIFAVWANRQVLNADNWGATSTALLQNSAIRTQLSRYLVDQIYANLDLAGELRSALPPRLQPLAGPAVGALQDPAQKVAFELLGRPLVEDAWKAANVITARQFINIVEGNSKLITLNGNAVFLDLRPIVGQLSQRLGLPSSLVQKLPPGAGRLRIMTSNQISLVQGIVNLVRGLALILPAVALLLFALAVFLSVNRRRHALLVVGGDLLIAGIVVLIARNVAGNQIVNALVATDSVRPAAHATWSISTAMLSDVAQSTVIVGVAVLLAAWLAGPRRAAVGLRRAASPWLRDRPGVSYGVVLAVLLLIVLWGPIPATRMPIPVLIMIGLFWLGTEALRRQTAVEFPDARIGDTIAALRARMERWRGARRRRPTSPPAPIGGGSGLVPDRAEKVTLLERLVALRDAGALTEEEFAAEKATIFGSSEIAE